MAESRINNKRTKHIHYKYHKVRESIELGLFDLIYVHSNLNVVDVLLQKHLRGDFSKSSVSGYCVVKSYNVYEA